MEADWEFQIGAESPVIDACWSGFVDLHMHPERAENLPEAAEFPAMAHALVRLNAPGSPVWTSKCDFFPALDTAEFDAIEMDGSPQDAAHAAACYIDLLPASGAIRADFKQAGEDCERTCAALHGIALSCCRADLVIRRAVTDGLLVEFGVTAYISACGSTSQNVRLVLAEALSALADSVAAGVPRNWL